MSADKDTVIPVDYQDLIDRSVKLYAEENNMQLLGTVTVKTLLGNALMVLPNGSLAVVEIGLRIKDVT